MVDLAFGFSFEGGRTNVMVAASYLDTNPLLTGERNLVQRGREHIFAHDPSFFLALSTPPLGATPNIRSNTGESLILDDGTPLNSPITHIPEGYLGRLSDDGAALVANAGQYNLELPKSAQLQGARKSLLNNPETRSLMMTLRREIAPHIQSFVDLQASDTSSHLAYNEAQYRAVIAADAPNNPFQQAIRVAVPTVGIDSELTNDFENRKAVAGIIVKLPGQWKAEVDLAWNRLRVASVVPGAVDLSTLNAINIGSLDVLRDLAESPIAFPTAYSPTAIRYPSDSVLKSAAVITAGSLPWLLPAGEVMLSTLVEHRKESLSDSSFLFFPERRDFVPGRNQTVTGVYVEAQVPLISMRNRLRGVELLDLQLAARRDHYRINSATGASPASITKYSRAESSTDPTFGVRYQPIKDITLRASYGTGYRPPSMSELAPLLPFSGNLSFLRDPLRGNEPLGTLVPVLRGGNPGLRSEISESWSLGIIFTPRWVPGLRLSADWNRIQKDDNIGTLALVSQDGLNLAITHFPDRITRGTLSGGYDVGPIVGLDNTSINIARLSVEALDLSFEFQRETESLGRFGLSIRATNLIDSKTQATPIALVEENVGLESAIAWRANVSIDWAYGGWRVGWGTRFYDSYFLNLAHTLVPRQGSAAVPSQTYHDLFGSYHVPTLSKSVWSVLANTEVRFSINNIFNTKPPVDTNRSDLYYSTLGDPRLATYHLSVRKSFQ